MGSGTLALLQLFGCNTKKGSKAGCLKATIKPQLDIHGPCMCHCCPEHGSLVPNLTDQQSFMEQGTAPVALWNGLMSAMRHSGAVPHA